VAAQSGRGMPYQVVLPRGRAATTRSLKFLTAYVGKFGHVCGGRIRGVRALLLRRSAGRRHLSARASSTAPRGSSWRAEAAEADLSGQRPGSLAGPLIAHIDRSHREHCQPESLCNSCSRLSWVHQCRSVGQLSRCKQVSIDVADAAPEQMLASDGVQTPRHWWRRWLGAKSDRASRTTVR